MRAIVVVLALVAALVAVVEGAVPCDVVRISPDCYVALRPGPTRDVLGIVDVTGEEVSTSAGQFVLTTVAVDQTLELDDLWRIRTDPTIDRADREVYFPPDVEEERTREFFAVLMEESELAASVAALGELGYELPPDGALVSRVLPDGPSADVVDPGDVVVAVDGRSVETRDAFADAVATAGPGAEVVLTIRPAAEATDGEAGDDQAGGDEGPDGGDEVGSDGTVERQLTLGANPDDPDAGFAGLLVTTNVEVPVDLEFDVGRIGGPSAGLMFALAIVDLLSEEDLTAGRVVAGTGEIDVTGRVGPIGGIKQKLPGAVQRPDDDGDAPAEVFLLPRGNVAEARQAVPGRDLLLVPVDTLGDAVDALRTLRDGEEPAGAFTLPAAGLGADAATVDG